MIRPFIEKDDFDLVFNMPIAHHDKLRLIADMTRLNVLTAVKEAGSGHLGSSFSSGEIVTYLYYNVLKIDKETLKDPQRNIFFSSKGHDVPFQYATLYALGIISKEKFLRLRKLGGLDGHPDIGIDGIEANSGSLGMGISKAAGMAWAKHYLNYNGSLYVVTGDGEFQEGQNFEALQFSVARDIRRLTVIMDHNKVQSDKYVHEILSLRDLKAKLQSFGWEVLEIDGHNYDEIAAAIAHSETSERLFIIANTIKGKGVSFMEHPRAMQIHQGLYPYHAGAPDDINYKLAFTEIIDRIMKMSETYGVPPIRIVDLAATDHEEKIYNALGEPVSQTSSLASKLKQTAEYVVEAYGEALVSLGKEFPHLVVLDADLSSDCRLRKFENTFPERFIECGISEQNMVSVAGGLARMGLLPVVNSFASFLASRANEQIYNNATEKTHIIYVFHYGGLIPAGPGKSHQSLRDISLVGALPDITIVQPCNPVETYEALRYFILSAKGPCVLRLNIGPSPSKILLPSDYRLAEGKGTLLNEGQDIAIVAYGPVMLHEALKAAEILYEKGMAVRVYNMPWLNKLDLEWFLDEFESLSRIFIVEDHSTYGGLGHYWLKRLNEENLLGLFKLNIIGVDGYPACGTPAEALLFHELDGKSLARRIYHEMDKAMKNYDYQLK